jgi:hypothetical protein
MIDNDDVLDFIETHRAAYAVLAKAEDDFNASTAPDDNDPMQAPMHTACRIERRLYDALLSARPSTVEGMAALIGYVDEVARQQDERGHRDDGPGILLANLKEMVRLAA